MPAPYIIDSDPILKIFYTHVHLSETICRVKVLVAPSRSQSDSGRSTITCTESLSTPSLSNSNVHLNEGIMQSKGYSGPNLSQKSHVQNCFMPHISHTHVHLNEAICRATFQNQLLKKILSGIPSECQTVWIHIRPNILSGMIWVQTVCIG